jgi:thioredoxin-related protein
MKKLIYTLFIIALSISVNAQKVYQTKSGKIKFFSSTSIEDIEAINTQADCKLATNGQMVFMVAIKGFKFDNSLMQEHFNEDYMESAKFPKAVFMGNIVDLKAVDFTKDGSYKITVKGNLEIHGVKKETTATGTIDIKGGKVQAKSVFKINVTDFAIKGKAIGSEVSKTLEITVDAKYD